MLTTGETYVPDKPEASLPMRLRAWYAWLLKINFCFSAAAREEPHMNTPQNANWNSIHFVTVCIYQPRLSQKCPLSNYPPKKPSMLLWNLQGTVQQRALFLLIYPIANKASCCMQPKDCTGLSSLSFVLQITTATLPVIGFHSAWVTVKQKADG